MEKNDGMPEKMLTKEYAQTRRQAYNILKNQLETERSSFLSHWRSLGDYILPRRPRFTVTDVNRGDRRNNNIVDSTAVQAARTLRSGMMGGITSPARPWFKLTTSDAELSEYSSVKEWLFTVSQRMNTVFTVSNLYNTLPIIYGDMGVFGTAAMLIEEDLEDGIRTYPFAIGSYMISNNHKMKVDTFFREYQLTVRQLVEKFGTKDGKWDNISKHVKNLWDQGNYETWISICHVIRPNEMYDPKRLEAKYKKYSSVYYEAGSQVNGSQNYMDPTMDNIYLRESGYDYFPVLAPRWEVNGEDAYGTNCPGMEALGDIKQLQLGEKRTMQAIEKMINPAMTGPTSLMHRKASILPGDITYVDPKDPSSGFRPVYQIDPRIQELELKQQQVRQRISRAFYEDLFLMLANSDRRQITAREIDERHEEKLLALGPVLEQLNQDLLDPLIDVTFNYLNKQGRIPPPPDEIQGSELKVEYISVMSQAQKLISIAGIDRFTGFVGSVVNQTQDMSILDKVNADELVSTYADITGVEPGILRSEEEVAAIREGRQKAQQQQQAAQNMQQMAGAANSLANAPLDRDNALGRLLEHANAGNLTPQ